MRFFELSVPACLPTCLPVCPCCDAVIVTILHSILTLTLTLTLTTPLFLSASALPVNDNDKSGAGIHEREREQPASLGRMPFHAINSRKTGRWRSGWGGRGGSSKAARPKPSCVFVCRLHQRKNSLPNLTLVSYHTIRRIKYPPKQRSNLGPEDPPVSGSLFFFFFFLCFFVTRRYICSQRR